VAVAAGDASIASLSHAAAVADLLRLGADERMAQRGDRRLLEALAKHVTVLIAPP
jgi:hypothetical protein